MNKAVQRAIETGSATEYGDQYMRALIRLEAGDSSLRLRRSRGLHLSRPVCA
jgi:hypothetical protein